MSCRLKELLKKFKKLFNNYSRGWEDTTRKPVSKRASWEKVGNKYKALPYFRIEDYETHKELLFYQYSPLEPHVSTYKMPLKIMQIVFIAKFFPNDKEFFKQKLVEAFDNMRMYNRKTRRK